MFPSSRSHYQDGDGRLISVPYFSAVQALFYNRAHLAAAGITGPPSTFADAYRDSKRLRELGISQTPYTGYWAHQVIEQAFVTYLLAAGVTPFDKDGAPVFADDGRSIELLEWWQAMCTEGLAQASVLTDSVDVVAKHMAEGRFTFMQSQHYWVKAIRGSDGPEASNVYLAERMHGAADIVLQIGEVIQVGDAARAGAWDLARFYGWRSPWTGDRATLRAWAIDAGLVAPYPALFEDAEIRRHFSAFVDPDHLRTIFEFHSDTVPARELPWYAAFKEDCGTRLHALLAGAADPRGTLEGIASDARKRASDHRRMHKSP
jgi:multiple sugar transport system substrate-binding protein